MPHETDEELTAAAVNALPTMANYPPRERQRLIYACKGHVLAAIATGERNPEKLAEMAEKSASEDHEVYGSPILLIMALGAIIQWLILRILDRWFPRKHGGHQ